MDVRHEIEGVGVTLIDANHCPGAAMMLFEVPVPCGKPGGSSGGKQQVRSGRG